LAAARASERRWAAGEPAGLLDGVPTSVKDLLLTGGWPTLRGSRTVDAAGPWTADAPAGARLREHGAVLAGQTPTPAGGWKDGARRPARGGAPHPGGAGRRGGRVGGGRRGRGGGGLGPAGGGHRRRRVDPDSCELRRRRWPQADPRRGSRVPAEPVRH